jgi:deoxycytidine triphosphate deaminase
LSKRLPACPEDDPDVKCGVLTSDKIEYCVEKFHLIDPFDKEKLLKPARYKITLGEDYAMGGKLRKLHNKPGMNELTIPPFQVAIVSTQQILNMPRFLIARWNLDIDLVYKGLLWVGGPQVDPGYHGRLFCPIYNLSNEPVTLKLGDDIASIDFVRTTPFIKNKTIKYPRPPKRRELSHYNWPLQSALYEMAEKKIQGFEMEIKGFRKEIEKMSDRINRSIAGIFTVLAILVAAISLVFTGREGLAVSFWGWCVTVLSVSAFIVAIVPFLKTAISTLEKWLQDPDNPQSS